MAQYVCAASSFEPIDLSAPVILHALGRLQPSDSLLVMFDDELNVPVDIRKRSFVPRYCLPIHTLECDSSGAIKQHFLPIVDATATSLISQVRAYFDLIAMRFSKPSTDSVASNVTKRFEELSLVLNRQLGRLPICKATDFFREVIEHIYTSILETANVKVSLYSEFLNTDYGQQSSFAALLRACRAPSVDDTRNEFRFLNGGYVEAYVESSPLRFFKGSSTSRETVLSSGQSNFHLAVSPAGKRYEVSVRAPDGQIRRVDRIALRGPLLIALLAQLGQHVHMPWYATPDTSSDSKSSIRSIEVVSPITVSSHIRSSKAAGGLGNRLSPSGYSLVEYKHPNVRSFIAAVARVPTDECIELDDWIYLINNFPVSRQKGSKHQGNVGHYVCKRFMDVQRIGVEGNIETFLRPNSDYIPNLGQTLLAYVSILNAMRKLWYLGSQESSRQPFKAIEWVSDDNIMYHAIGARLQTLIERSSRWRREVVQAANTHHHSKDNSLEIVRSYFNIMNTIARDIDWHMYDDGARTPMARSLFNMYRHCAYRELKLYYRTVLSLVTSTLKATIWNCWLILETNDYDALCREIIERRGDRAFIDFRVTLSEWC